MKRKIVTILMSGVILLSTSCASIVSKSSYPISISSAPKGAKVTITDKKGIDIYQGTTPASLNLKAGNGFFSKARYQVKFEKEGFDTKTIPLESSIDGWYFGNILIGGFIGLLIIDPATGAMYKLDQEYIHATLIESSVANILPKEDLKIYSINDIPVEWKDHLTAVGK